MTLMPARSSLRAFLATSKRRLQSSPHSDRNESLPSLTFVIGNSSADLDSIASSILLAYFQKTQNYTCLAVPLLNISRTELRLRPELKELLLHCNVEEDHLSTLDDVGFGNSPDTTFQPFVENAQFLLVDHNALTPPLHPKYKERVIGCIDHHVDEHSIPPSADPRILGPSGSCASLVLRHIRTQWDALSLSATTTNSAGGQVDTAVGVDDAAVRRTWDAQIAKLALAPILVDTSNLQSTQTRDVDREAVSYLKSKIALAPQLGATFDAKAFFEKLIEAKKDISGMSCEDLLARDYKEWEGVPTWSEENIKRGKRRRLGISSTVTGIKTLVSKASQANSDIESELTRYAQERNLDVLALMTKDNDEKTGEFTRDLVLCSPSEDHEVHGMLSSFVSEARSELGLERSPEDGNKKDVISKWHQRSLDKTRKQVAPLLRRAMRIENS